MKSKIPESLRQQLSKAGKARARTFKPEDRIKAGKASWETRLRKARIEEAQKKQRQRPDITTHGPARIVQNPNINTKGLW